MKLKIILVALCALCVWQAGAQTVKSSFLLSFLESAPEVSAKLKEANTKEGRFEDVVKSVQDAAVLVLVY